MNDNIYIGKLGKTIGLKGHLKLYIDTDFPEQFKKDANFFTNRGLSLKVAEYSPTKETILFESYDNVDTAKKLTNQEIFTTQEETRKNCKLDKNQFFWFDLIGCAIYEENLLLGTVKEVLRYPLSDYLEITTDKDLVDKSLPKTFLIPHVFDKYVIEVNIETKTIRVKNSLEILENS